MITAFLVVLLVMFCLILVTTLKALKLDGKSYFIEANYSENTNPEVGFYIKKHTIFRFFALFYQVVHCVLQVISITSTSITLYMLMDEVPINTQIFFLLVAAISINLIISFRFDKLAECYGTAMRIMENAILIYISQETKEIKILYEANDKAEQHIGNKFF